LKKRERLKLFCETNVNENNIEGVIAFIRDWKRFLRWKCNFYMDFREAKVDSGLKK